MADDIAVSIYNIAVFINITNNFAVFVVSKLDLSAGIAEDVLPTTRPFSSTKPTILPFLSTTEPSGITTPITLPFHQRQPVPVC